LLTPEKDSAPELEYQTIPANPVASETPRTGRWEKNCIFVQVPNPNFGKPNDYMGAYIYEEQCSQVYLQD
jgi:hypothetical protein